LARLPKKEMAMLRHYIPDWLYKHIKQLAGYDRDRTLEILEQIADSYRAAGPGILSSGIGSTTIGGVVQDRSEVSINKAINSPGGKLAQALWELLPTPRKGKKFPKYLDHQFQRLFSLPGDGGGHAVAVVTQHLGWLDYWFRDWVNERILPMFDPRNPCSEAAWHGLAYDRNGLSLETLAALKPSLLAVLTGKVDWSLDQQEYRNHIHRLIATSQPDLKRGAKVEPEDVRQVLMAVDDLGRSEAVNALSNIMQRKDNWQSFVKPFLEQAWPRHAIYKGEQSSRAFAALASESGDNFPDVVKTILPFLRPVAHLDLFAHYAAQDDDEKHNYASKFPSETLQMLGVLIDENRPTVPYELPKVLERLASAKPSLRRSSTWRRLHELTL
jgi:hypothetical protein